MEAYKQVKTSRAVAKPRTNFLRQLVKFEKALQERQENKDKLARTANADTKTDPLSSSDGTLDTKQTNTEEGDTRKRKAQSGADQRIGPSFQKKQKGPARGPVRGPQLPPKKALGPQRGPQRPDKMVLGPQRPGGKRPMVGKKTMGPQRGPQRPQLDIKTVSNIVSTPYFDSP